MATETATKAPAAPAAPAPAAPDKNGGKRGRKPTPENETPRAKFRRLTNSRVERALSAMVTIASLANPREYEYNAKDIANIEKILNDTTAEIAKRLRDALAAGKPAAKHGSLDLFGDEPEAPAAPASK